MKKAWKVSVAAVGLSFSALSFSLAQQSEVVVPKLDKKISREAFLRDKLTDQTVAYVRIPTLFGMAFNMKNKASDKVMENNANERAMLHIKKVLQDPSLVNEILQKSFPAHMSLADSPMDLGSVTSLIYTGVNGPIEVIALDVNKMISPATQLLITVPVKYQSADEMDVAMRQIFRNTVNFTNQGGFYPISDSALIYFDQKEKRLFISLGQKALSQKALKETIDGLKTTKQHKMYAYENQIDLSGQNLFAWADITGSRDMVAMIAKEQSPLAGQFIQSTEGLALGIGTTADKNGQAKIITKTNVEAIPALRDFAKPLTFKTVGEPNSVAILALPSKNMIREMAKLGGQADSLAEFEQESQKELSINVLNILDILGGQVIAYEDDTGTNLALSIQDKAALDELIKKLAQTNHVTHKVTKGIHELKVKNPIVDIMKKESNENYQSLGIAGDYGRVYGQTAFMPLIAELMSAIYGIRFMDENLYIYWSDEDQWLVLNTLPYSLQERKKAKVSLAKWLENQSIRSSGIVASYTGSINNAEEKWYRDYLKFMRNNYDLLGQHFDLYSMPAPASLKFKPTSRIGAHTAIDKDWIVMSLDYDISPFYGYSLFSDQGGLTAVSAVGVLSMFALPAYQDYTKRTYVSEGLALSTSAKLASTEYYSTVGEWPQDNAEAGLPVPTRITGQGVNGIEIIKDGIIKIIYNDKVQTGGYLTLKSRVINSHYGNVSWHCYETNLPSKLLPVKCRTEVAGAAQ